MDKEKLTREVWSKESYYKTAGEGSLDTHHPGMKKLNEIAIGSKTILDMGCGEGTRLNELVGKIQVGYGIDISRKAIELAKRKYPQLNFEVGDLEKLPYGNEKFDLVYSAFVFEHLDNPEKVLREAVRVLGRGGNLVIIAPNYGAPNRASPPYKGNRVVKLLKGFFKDFLPVSKLGWQKVEPIAGIDGYQIDWDTTVEPYMGSLISFVKRLGMKVKYTDSSWGMESKGAGLMQKLFRFLGEINIYPFKNWGPHLIVVSEK
jgi:ubiquinone/menaquinone biosynthesis C-methylase UbiE